MLIFFSLLAVIAGYLVYIYNKCIRLQNLLKEGWSGIDIQLKQRANLIPNLVEAVKGYMNHEAHVLENVTKLRSQCMAANTVADRAANENMMTSALRQLFALSESYPDLKASQNFIDLQKNLQNIEDQIQLARRYYNGTARDFNILIESFPNNLIARPFHFQSAIYFEIEDTKEREVPAVKFS